MSCSAAALCWHKPFFSVSGHRQDVRPRYPLVAPGAEGHAAAPPGDAPAEAGEDPAAVGGAGIGEGY